MMRIDDMQAEPRYTLQEAAQQIGMGQRALFRELRRRRVLDNHNLPTWRYCDSGLFGHHEHTYRHPAAGIRFYSRAYVTARGLDWLRGELGGYGGAVSLADVAGLCERLAEHRGGEQAANPARFCRALRANLAAQRSDITRRIVRALERVLAGADQ